MSKGQDPGGDYLDSSAENVIMHEGQRLFAAVVIFFKVKTNLSRAESADRRWLCVTVQQGKRAELLKPIERNLHGVIDSSQHLNHKLWVQQHTVA